jgi:ankyrin repeat protein
LHSIGERFENGLFFPSVAGGGTILMYAYHFNIPELQNALLNAPNITINLPNKEGRTALMVAVDGYQFIMNINGSPIHPVTLQHPAITFLTNYPHVNINQQDAQGNTALLIALETKKIIKAKQQIIRDIAKFVITERPATPQEDLIQALLDAGADPELANNEGLTPLQAALDSGNQNIIQLIQDAITRKHNQQ